MNIVKKISNIITTIVITITVILAILLAGVRVVGLTPYTVLSGSMEPTYHVGSIIYVKDVNPRELKVNDPVTYTIEGGTVVTHRIIEVIEEENSLQFRTQGDANKMADGGLLPAGNILGQPVFSIPYLGYVASVIQTKQGIAGIAGVCVVLVLITVIVETIGSLMKKEEEPKS